MEKRTSRVSSRKIRGSRKPRASRIAKQWQIGERTGVPQGCTAVHPGQNHAQQPKLAHGPPCVDARSDVRQTHGRALVHGQPCVVRGCTATRAALHGRAVSGPPAVSRFFGLLFQFCFIFWGLFSRLL